MEDTKSVSGVEHSEVETDGVTKFDKSLQELRDLCSQLHHAANYCEATFLNAEQKRTVVENTKEYLCRAVVTVVDHLGNISSNLECELSMRNTISETEIRIDSLKQRLGTCQQYSHKLSLRRHCLNAEYPRYYSRYISPPIRDLLSTDKILREPAGCPNAARTIQFETEEDVPLFLYTYTCKPSLVANSKSDQHSEKRSSCELPVLPVRGGLSMLPKAQHSHILFQECSKLNRKSVQYKDLVMSLIRRGKRIKADKNHGKWS